MICQYFPMQTFYSSHVGFHIFLRLFHVPKPFCMLLFAFCLGTLRKLFIFVHFLSLSEWCNWMCFLCVRKTVKDTQRSLGNVSFSFLLNQRGVRVDELFVTILTVMALLFISYSYYIHQIPLLGLFFVFVFFFNLLKHM